MRRETPHVNAPNSDVVSNSAAPSQRTWVSRISVNNFRCYTSARLELEPRSVVLSGSNGAGKTSVLEALSVLAPGRGLRRARLDELVRDASESPAREWTVIARIHSPAGVSEIGTGVREEPAGAGRDRRRVHIDGRPVRGQNSLADALGVVWLTPEMDRLFLEGAATRRRFLDHLVVSIDPNHAERLGAYERAMQQRGRLLRDVGADPAWLSALEDVMASSAVAIAAARREISDRLTAASGGSEADFPGARIEAVGDVEGSLAGRPALEAEERLKAALARARVSDGESGRTSVGTHRSDMRVHHARSGRPAAVCSTGEQKTLLVAIVLSAVRVQAVERGALPVLLLDEVAAHLDRRHRCALYDEVEALGVQAWFAGTDRTVFQPLADRVQFFSVEAATVRREAARSSGVFDMVEGR